MSNIQQGPSEKHSGRARPRKRPDKAPKRDRGDWVVAARDVLISEGINRVRVEQLAKDLRVTTGSFYHHFSNREELLDALLDHWEVANNDPIFAAVDAAGPDPLLKIEALFQGGIWGGVYDASYDSAVRAWARESDRVKERVRIIDDRRIALLKSMFVELGYDEVRAFVRARVAYFHQVGYQALEILESSEERALLAPFYGEVLAGVIPKGAV